MGTLSATLVLSGKTNVPTSCDQENHQTINLQHLQNLPRLRGLFLGFLYGGSFRQEFARRLMDSVPWIEECYFATSGTLRYVRTDGGEPRLEQPDPSDKIYPAFESRRMKLSL